MPNQDQLPQAPDPGPIWVRGRWYDQIRRWLTNIRFTDGLGRVIYNDQCINISLDATGIVSAGGGGGTGSGMTPVEILAATTAADTYLGLVYGNGTATNATITDATIKVLQIADTETVPNGTQLPAWQQAWVGGTYYTVDVARDYGTAT